MSEQEAEIEHERLLRLLVAEPDKDSDAAEVLCDQMDLSWHAMSAAGRKRMRALGAELCGAP